MAGRALFALLVLAGIAAAEVSAEKVFGAVTGMLRTDGFKVVTHVYPAPDGAFWVTGLSFGLGGPQAISWFARRFSSTGAALGPGASTNSLPDLMPTPVGTTSDGGLVADVLGFPENRGQFLAKVSPTGTIDLTKRLPPHHQVDSYVGRDGLVHLVGNEAYTQVDMTRRGLPVVRTLVYERPFGRQESVPGYLRWGGQLAFLSDGDRRLLVATRMMGCDGSRFRLCRVDTKTLALLDSGSINVYEDTSRTWRGPEFRTPQTFLVPTDDAGYWLFVANYDPPPAGNIWAYRVGPDLKPVRPREANTVASKSFSEAPSSSVVRIQCTHRTQRLSENGAWVVPSVLTLDFVAFGCDGQVYVQTLTDSFTIRVNQ